MNAAKIQRIETGSARLGSPMGSVTEVRPFGGEWENPAQARPVAECGPRRPSSLRLAALNIGEKA